MKYIGSTEEYLQLTGIDKTSCVILKEEIADSLSALWFDSSTNELNIDGKDYSFNKNQIVFLTEFHKVEVTNIDSIRFLRFNRPFYCIKDHDTEVGCNGLLFFGASQLPIINIPNNELEKFETLWKMFTLEMQSSDNLQIDMLQMMLKRYLILCTRLYKTQANYPATGEQTDIVRSFNFLVEQHFNTKHTVAEYADLLSKSPKTLSNLFSKMGAKSPMQFIQDRKMLEARRLLRYSSKQIQEIAYEIGYNDVQTFSRFFKNQEGISPTEFKENR